MAPAIISSPGRVLAYVNQFVPVQATAGMKGLGLERAGQLQAGVLYEGWNGHNVWMHVAITPGARLTRQFVRYCFHYPFVELGCSRISGYVEARNEAARRFDERLGFQQEAVLRGAASDGGDVILYVMWRKDCRHV